MRARGNHTTAGAVAAITLLLQATWLSAGDDASAQKKADQRFDNLLAAARKDPTKADWQVLRRAFAETSRYNPYNLMWDEEIDTLEERIETGNAKDAETLLNKLLERECFMRLDALKLAVALYKKTGQKEKVTHCSTFVQGISNTLIMPGLGSTIEKPIEVLFLEEESVVLEALNLPVKNPRLVEHAGHHLNVFTYDESSKKEARAVYFNIDLPFKAQSGDDKLLDEKDLADPGK